MSPETQQSDNSTDRRVSRRSLLAGLATGGGVAALAALTNADAPEPERTSLGGNSKASTGAAYRHDGFSLAPTTRPPDQSQRLAWLHSDELGVWEQLLPDTLPASWSASGLQWGVATDLATARSEAGVPGIALVDDGTAGKFVCEVQLPDSDTAFTNAGLEIVMAGDLPSADSMRSQTPAVLFGADGTAEVVV